MRERQLLEVFGARGLLKVVNLRCTVRVKLGWQLRVRVRSLQLLALGDQLGLLSDLLAIVVADDDLVLVGGRPELLACFHCEFAFLELSRCEHL